MDKNVEYLNYIHQNTQMGVKSIENLMEVISDPQTSEHLKLQLESYKQLNADALAQLHARGHEEKDVSAMKQVMSYVSINVQTMVDRSPAHVAEMMMQGNLMGIIDITKNRKKYESADKEIVNLGDKLMKLEEDGLKQWTKYLSITVA